MTATLYREVVITNPSSGVATANTLGASQNLKLNFTATAGDSPSVNLAFALNSGYADLATTPKYIKVYKPDGTLLLEGPNYNVAPTGIKCNAQTNALATACNVQLANLPVSGTYTVVVQPYSYSGASITVTATLYREVVITNPSSGVATANVLSPSQNLKLSFPATAGDSPSVYLQFAPSSGYDYGNTTTPRYIKVYKPDGTLLLDGPLNGITIANNGIACNRAATGAAATACTVQLANLPVSGTYSIVVQPYSATGGSITVTATLTRQAAYTLISGSPIPAVLAPAQSAVFSFTAAVGDTPGLSLAFSPSSGYAGSSALTPRYIKVYRPNGTLLLDGPINGSTTGIVCNGGTTPSTSCTATFAALAVGGTYKVVVQPLIYTGTVTVTATFMAHVPPPLPGAPSSITVPTTGVLGVLYTIRWGAASGVVANYVLYESEDPTFLSQAICTKNIPPTCFGTFLTYSGPGLTATGPSSTRSRSPATYYYRVRACNESGCGPYATGNNGVVVQ